MITKRETKKVHEYEIDFYELLFVLKKRLKLIIAIFVLGVMDVSAVSFWMPNIYQARTTIPTSAFFQ